MPFDPRKALADPGFTPGAAHLPALFELLLELDDEQARRLERVIARAGSAALEQLAERYEQAAAEQRPRLVRIAGELSGERATALLLHALAGGDPTSRRWAARALGRTSADEAVERALLSAFATGDLPLQRALVEALGKVGGRAALEFLSAQSRSDQELARRTERALLLLKRRSERSVPSRIVLDRALPDVFVIRARTRAGLAGLALEELSAFAGVSGVSPSAVEFHHGGTLATLFTSRVALDFGVVLRAAAHTPGAEGLAALLSDGRAERVLGAWTDGALRFRLSYAAGGHHRAEVWKVAELLASASSTLCNDSREAAWEIVAGQRLDRDGVLLVPKAFADPRFAYRRADVPAASHPSVAAALARALGVRADDVVWDPFVGSGLELVERALLGPYARLIGSDLDPRALSAARANLEAAGTERVQLELAGALEHRPAGVTAIISNPPMGRRVARDGSLGALLSDFIAHAARILQPGGRLVWLSPLPQLTARAASAAGLRLEPLANVDMGGFSAELQRLTKPPRQ